MFGSKEVTVQVEARLAWEVVQDPATGTWIGVCRPLNLNAIGDTWTEFQEAASEAVQLLFDDLFADGELPAFLRRNGWRLRGEMRPGARPVFDVPVEIHRLDRVEELSRAVG